MIFSHQVQSFALLIIALTSAVASAAEPKPRIVVDSPQDYQVYQRTDANVGSILVLVQPVDAAQCRLIGTSAAGPLPGVWKEMVPAEQYLIFSEARLLAVKLDGVPAGGWYRLEIRSPDGPTAVVEHVGIGEVFIIAGQSNSTNYGAEKQTTKTGLVSSFDGNAWILANDPQPGVQDGSKNGSFIPAFGDALATKLGVPVGVACVGAGSTSVREWLPKGTKIQNQPTTGRNVHPTGPNEWEVTGRLYDGLIARMDKLSGFRAILWHQGESDAGQARAGYPADRQITGAQYAEYMKTLIAATRKHERREVPWFVAQVTYHSEKDPADEEFRAAQASLWKDRIAFEGPDTDALRAEYRAGVHFNAKGQIAHGTAWADKVAGQISAPSTTRPAAKTH